MKAGTTRRTTHRAAGEAAATRAVKRTRILVVDVGGSRVKCAATGHRRATGFPSGTRMAPPLLMAELRRLTHAWCYDAVTLGYPGVVRQGRIAREPRNLAEGWAQFDFEEAFGCPVRIINDAAMQAVGSYRGGSMLFLGLGTGLGTTLIVDGTIAAMELAHLPYQDGASYEEVLGAGGRKRLGEARWQQAVFDVVQRFREALLPDEIVLGGGNAQRLPALPEQTRRGSNANALIGGFRLWEDDFATGAFADQVFSRAGFVS